MPSDRYGYLYLGLVGLLGTFAPRLAEPLLVEITSKTLKALKEQGLELTMERRG